MIINANSIVQHTHSIKNGIMINTNMSVNKYKGCTKDYIWNPSTYVCENSKYLKSAIDESAIA